jgi:alkanesulfonate monooxygenase SsuD/methylene tetrahydromethanopterin reductase-like flavin-dependent oxidoreductase (luciferase family)
LYQLAINIIHQTSRPLQPPVEDMETIWSEAEKAAILQMMQYTFIGSPAVIKQKLQHFLDSTGVDEIMITSHIYNHYARLRSYEIVQEIWK